MTRINFIFMKLRLHAFAATRPDARNGQPDDLWSHFPRGLA